MTSLKKENCITNKSTCGIIPSSQATSGPPNVYILLYLPTTTLLCTPFFAEHWFILENEIKQFQIKISEFHELRNKYTNFTPCLFVWLVGFFLVVFVIAMPMVGITNIFSQAGSLILNNFDKYQRKFLLFLVRPLVNNLICFQHSYNTHHRCYVSINGLLFFFSFFFSFFQISNVDSYGKMLNLFVLIEITFFG